ncbi:PLD nuclease N-terminal domain-containing protein [Kutzneria kofuensis]|uniref:Fatty acid desaturase n=1 Tax=Kutzneria kofuensis TaxID=103725 RepID=A0A7W9KNJ5_9PSEU|nr:PLD nuclease N-terminal domain-containing protein [Kutzneria kofuensis]MBB5895832.1 fatty acid desaturase [Kutzneria kofuensis]
MTFTHLAIVLPMFVLYVVALVDVLRLDMDGSTRVGWVLGILVLPVVGAVAWLVFGRRTVRRASA